MKKRIDLILLEKGMAPTRAKAQAMIMAGQISVDDKIITKSGENINYESNIKVSTLGAEWVSRGSTKLLHALKIFKFDVSNKVCLDLGASTGGFSEVLLKKNAKKIYSVDVGTNQLHEKLKQDKKIINLERTNAKYLNRKIIKDELDLIVCDVSFISMKKVLSPCISFLNQNTGSIIGLIKPQFEADKKEIKRGGVVKDSLVHNRICDDFSEWFTKFCKMNVIGIIKSPIKGPKGNIEFLIFAKF